MNQQKTEEIATNQLEPKVQQSAHPIQLSPAKEQTQNDANPIAKRVPGELTARNKQVSHQAQTIDINKSSSRNKISINLPYLTSHSNFGDKIFDKQSASTLQKTILVYSIPKANRFNRDPKYSGEPSYCIDTCFKPSPSKGAGFGFGRKKQYPDWMQRNMKENPPPGAYFDNLMDIRRKGKTFGISHKYYQKVLIPKQKHSSFQVARKLSPIHDQGK